MHGSGKVETLRDGAGQCCERRAACLESESKNRLAYLELIAAYLG